MSKQPDYKGLLKLADKIETLARGRFAWSEPVVSRSNLCGCVEAWDCYWNKRPHLSLRWRYNLPLKAHYAIYVGAPYCGLPLVYHDGMYNSAVAAQRIRDVVRILKARRRLNTQKRKAVTA